jgi:hypothetical protein
MPSKQHDAEVTVKRPSAIASSNFGGPATYRVVVQGEVGQDWIGRLGGMAITTTSQESGAPRTTLQGRILDQSALRGILETLYALHLLILEVKKVDTDYDLDTTANGG